MSISLSLFDREPRPPIQIPFRGLDNARRRANGHAAAGLAQAIENRDGDTLGLAPLVCLDDMFCSGGGSTGWLPNPIDLYNGDGYQWVSDLGLPQPTYHLPSPFDDPPSGGGEPAEIMPTSRPPITATAAPMPAKTVPLVADPVTPAENDLTNLVIAGAAIIGVIILLK